RAAARTRLGLDPDGDLVAGVGAGSWRKGIDLFLQVAAKVRAERGDDVRFAWVGPVDDPDETGHDLRALGLDDAVTLVGEVEDPAPWFDALDVLLLTSREDPFPLVVLEAGLAARPVVSFTNGGAPEVIEPDGGAVVGYLDIDAMAAATADLLADDAARTAAGEALQDRVRARHVTRVGAPAMWRALTRP
ncbi:MAG: glycosyltransferase, partial [Actinomycetota bacterium]